jgi:predicted alpha/beta superfamily hydrolase
LNTVGKRGRATEYLPYPDEYVHPPEPDVKGKLYPQFVVTEVLPLVNARFRTLAGPAKYCHRRIVLRRCCCSLHGDTETNVFGKLLIESPSLYIAEGKLFSELERAARWPLQVYIGVGTNEGGQLMCPGPTAEEPEAVRDARKLASLANEHAKVRFVIEPCAVHNEDAWAARLPQALKFLFPVQGR